MNHDNPNLEYVFCIEIWREREKDRQADRGGQGMRERERMRRRRRERNGEKDGERDTEREKGGRQREKETLGEERLLFLSRSFLSS